MGFINWLVEAFGGFFKNYAPQITVILASFLAIVGNRKQSAREYLAKSRSDTLNMTKTQFSEFVTAIYKLWNYKVMGVTYAVNAEAIDRKNVAVLNLETSFNPSIKEHDRILKLIKEIEIMTMSLDTEIVPDEQNFGEKNKENSQFINSKIKPLMEDLKSEMQVYFYNEWEQIKREIRFQKK